MDNLKVNICAIIGAIGGGISSMFGGWTTAMTTLLIFMGIDYLSGLIVAGKFQNSKKSENGGLQSDVCFKGLCKKAMILLILLVGCRLDIMLNTHYIKDAVCIGFVANETISILENAGLMGIPIPKSITKAIDILKAKGDNDDESKD